MYGGTQVQLYEILANEGHFLLLLLNKLKVK